MLPVAVVLQPCPGAGLCSAGGGCWSWPSAVPAPPACCGNSRSAHSTAAAAAGCVGPSGSSVSLSRA